MAATEKQYEIDSTVPGFRSEGQRLDTIAALEAEYKFRVDRGDDRADEVADELVKAGGDDPRKTPAQQKRAAAKNESE